MFQKFMSQQQPSDSKGAKPQTSVVSTATSKSRNQSSWRGGKRKNGIPRTNVSSGPQPSSTGSVPQGQYLSKVSSELSNDPLSEKAYFPGPSEEYKAVANRQKIFSACDALPLLSEEIYVKATCLSPAYGKTVPRSAHDYYMAVLTYYRLLTLHKIGGGSLSLGELNFLEQIGNANFTVPKSLSLYLSGFGDTKAPKSRELQFKMAKPDLQSAIITIGGSEYIVPGYFGDIALHLGLYASYPSLGVYYQRILFDLARTNTHNRPEVWDLPDEFSFPNHPINQNCLGYAPALILSQEQKSFYNNIGLTLHQFESQNDELPVNMDLLAAVHTKLSSTRQTLFPVSTSSHGSVGQITTQSVSTQNTSRTVAAIYRGSCAFEVPGAEGHLGDSFLYNICKHNDSLRIIKSFMPVSYRVNDHVTPEAIASINLLHSATADFIKPELYEVIPFSPSIRIEKVVRLDSPS